MGWEAVCWLGWVGLGLLANGKSDVTRGKVSPVSGGTPFSSPLPEPWEVAARWGYSASPQGGSVFHRRPGLGHCLGDPRLCLISIAVGRMAAQGWLAGGGGGVGREGSTAPPTRRLSSE